MRFPESPSQPWMVRCYEESGRTRSSTILFAESLSSSALGCTDAEMVSGGARAPSTSAPSSKSAERGTEASRSRGDANPEATRRAMTPAVDVLYRRTRSASLLRIRDFLLRAATDAPHTVCDRQVWPFDQPSSPFSSALLRDARSPPGGDSRKVSYRPGYGETRSFRIERFSTLPRFRDAFWHFLDVHPSARASGDSPCHGGWSGRRGAFSSGSTRSRVANIADRSEEAGRSGNRANEGAGRMPGKRRERGPPPASLPASRAGFLQIASESEGAAGVSHCSERRRGGASLPTASLGDVYFDIEGYPHAEAGSNTYGGAVGTDTSAPWGSAVVSPRLVGARHRGGEAPPNSSSTGCARAGRSTPECTSTTTPRTRHGGQATAQAKYATRETNVDDLAPRRRVRAISTRRPESAVWWNCRATPEDVVAPYREKRSEMGRRAALRGRYHASGLYARRSETGEIPAARHIRDYNERMPLHDGSGLWLASI